ncbi:MAG TPA: sialate O-acetylesterase [Candidatus Acidoferrum sp.]|nr:sialate O-acetylesterase [Candidatus Acidoferrum sp.]
MALLIQITSLPAAGLKLASCFGDHMVLQRDRPICIWGEGETYTSVKVRFASREAAATVGPDGHWQVVLKPVSRGGPYNLTLSSGARRIALNDILCGDVWLCSGQSNMQMPVKECLPAEQEATLAERPQVRLCTVAKNGSATHQSSADITWRTCTPESARDFSAVGYFFACELLKDRKLARVPIGLIDSSFGGTTCEGWIPPAALAAFSTNELHDSMFGIKPAALYNAMIAPLGQTGLRGVLWYQGESNSAHPDTYPRLFSTLAAEWRKQFDDPQLPFFVVQLPEYVKLWEGYYWPWIREAQAQAVAAVPHSALVPAIGTTDGFNLHPKEKLEIGRRLALRVRHDAYGERIVAGGPVFRDARIEGSAIRVGFDTGGDGLASHSPTGVQGFALAGSDGEYHFAQGRIDHDTVVVQCDAVPAPRTVRYAWTAVPNASLSNKSGLPAAPFRTDQLPCANLEVQKEPVSRRITASTYELSINGDGAITSLVVSGAQFISNQPGMAGGSSIPSFWGPRALANIRDLGPREISCSDDEVTLGLQFQETGMEWGITNRGKDAIRFQLAVAPGVNVSDPTPRGGLILRQGKAMLAIQGVDSVTETATGRTLVTEVAGASARQLAITAGAYRTPSDAAPARQ